jgi:hypothetical protein
MAFFFVSGEEQRKTAVWLGVLIDISLKMPRVSVALCL